MPLISQAAQMNVTLVRRLTMYPESVHPLAVKLRLTPDTSVQIPKQEAQKVRSYLRRVDWSSSQLILASDLSLIVITARVTGVPI